MLDAQGDSKSKLLVVDDDQGILNLLTDCLESDYSILTAINTKDATQLIHTDHPELILLDVNLQDASGLEMAKLLQNDPEFSNIPIIFMSGNFLKEDILAGYEVGGSDYVTKPFNLDELTHKINITLDFNKRIKEQTRVIDETRQMAFTAMSQSGEIGQILLFMRNSFEVDTYKKLSELILEYGESQQLNIVFRFNTSPPIFFSHEGEIARLDQEILERMSMLERIIDFGIRSVYNFPNVSLLIKNMPIDDEGLYGRIKDNICLILEAADAKIASIKNEATLREHDNSLKNVINDAQQTLNEIEASFQENAEKNAKIMMQLKEKIEWSFLQLGLSEDQEQEIADIINKAEEESVSLYDSGLKIEDRIASLTTKLKQS